MFLCYIYIEDRMIEKIDYSVQRVIRSSEFLEIFFLDGTSEYNYRRLGREQVQGLCNIM